ncbi:qaraquat-inducible protein B [Thioflavicoccus mobilis 8321]|uniref:Qaraquat-inducible protein B n=1 Tax=Thioflavicoccus mobilis 8321 TaxID=765912 RepID=L0GTT0_9GAMM|nr:MlaD family protein [Thioflavicoccus mobilis]AGA90163.1 qaraquat-inducible protein B [Thioflavicoccus mobilis 8321]
MPSPETGTAATDQDAPLPQAQLVQRNRISLVWLLPVLALVIGGWLAWKTLSERGPTVQIRFESAAGIEKGRTKVKLKDVVIGQVSDIRLTEDLAHVEVTAQLNDDTEGFLTENTRFWIARPRVTATGVSGLETLLSGPFVAIDPHPGKRSKREFVGLPAPPAITTADKGTQFGLRAPSLGSLSVGSPVYYRRIPVGRVVGYALADDNSGVDIDIFIETPHDRRVNDQSRFWNASGIDVSLSADGIQVDTDSVVAMVVGGVAFGNFGADGPPPAEGFRFTLLRNLDEARTLDREPHDERSFYMVFNGSVRGLSVGAPVLLRGIEIGEVTDIDLVFNPEGPAFEIPVRVEIDVNKIGLGADMQVAVNRHERLLDELVAKGLRGQLKQGSLITGQLFVELDIHPGAPPATLGQYDELPLLPTVEGGLEALTAKVDKVLTALAAIPFDEIGDNLNGTLAGTRAIVESPELSDAIRQASATLSSADATIAPDSPLNVELNRTLRAISTAARSVQVLADYLERHPEALLKGKGGGR